MPFSELENAAILAPVRDSLASNTPIAWHRINDLPDYVYLNHAIHITQGVGCAECHGRVDKIPLLHKVDGFTMSLFIDCQTLPGRDCDQRIRSSTSPGSATLHAVARGLMRLYDIGDRRLTDCSICHR